MALEREKIIAAALDLLDTAGLDGLTMRKLADALQVQAPSLYWHFSGKPALLDGLADALLTGLADAVDPMAGHAAVLHSAAASLRRALLSRRDGARVFAGTFVARPNVLRVADIVLGALLRAGFDSRTAVRAQFSMLYFVLGFVIEEQALLYGNPKLLEQEFTPEATQDFPSVRATLPAIVNDLDQDARFAFGIDLLIHGLEAFAPEKSGVKGT